MQPAGMCGTVSVSARTCLPPSLSLAQGWVLKLTIYGFPLTMAILTRVLKAKSAQRAAEAGEAWWGRLALRQAKKMELCRPGVTRPALRSGFGMA